MEQIEYPKIETWQERRIWFEQLFDINCYGGSAIMSEHALGLLIDLQAIYCAGAFVTCIILACTIVDAHLQDVEGANGGMKSTFAHSKHQEELEWLRQNRNRLIHFKTSFLPAISVDDHWEHHVLHENAAKKSIKLVANVLFENLGT